MLMIRKKSLPIGPIWNWNRQRTIYLQPSWRLPIGPIWNWNDLWANNPLVTTTLPIGPIWNWNGFILSVGIVFLRCQSDQSGIETATVLHAVKTVNTANRTNLELKLSRRSFVVILSPCCQSDQSGIETFIFRPSAASHVLPIGPIWNWNGFLI